jgi:hypothetical protein
MKTSQRLLLVVALAAGSGAVSGAALAAAPRAASDSPGQVIDLAGSTGAGETMLVVVAGSYVAPAEAVDAAQVLSFGDMQGFYVDASNNYQVLGFYDQTSPDLEVVTCSDNPPVVVLCSPGESRVNAYQPVQLAYIPLHRAAPVLDVGDKLRCGAVGQPPCMIGRVQRLLRPDTHQLPGGRTLLLTAFRTKQGAAEFVDLARGRGAEVAVLRVLKTGGSYVGLGQEAHPDGVSGPLLAPLPDPAAYQE